jgi:hypothetical protein
MDWSDATDETALVPVGKVKRQRAKRPLAPIFLGPIQIPQELKPIPLQQQARDIERMCFLFSIPTSEWPATPMKQTSPEPPHIKAFNDIPTTKVAPLKVWLPLLGLADTLCSSYIMLGIIIHRLEGWKKLEEWRYTKYRVTLWCRSDFGGCPFHSQSACGESRTFRNASSTRKNHVIVRILCVIRWRQKKSQRH